MVDIDSGSVYITNSTSVTTTTITGGTTIRITPTKIDQNYDNAITAIPIPVSTGGRDEQTPFARAVDLKRIKEAVSVAGFLEDESGESAFTKKTNLLNLGKNGDALTIVWGLGDYQTKWASNTDPSVNTGVFISKMTFTETAGLFGENVTASPQPERNIAIQIQLVRGKDM